MDNSIKSDDTAHHMDMMMMTSMMQDPIDYMHHHHHHHAASSPFLNLPSSTLPQPFPMITAPAPAYPSASVYSKRSSGNGSSSSMAAMREMIFRMAVMQPVHIDPESVKPPKRRNVRISKDPQSVAARHRRERISEKIRILQRLVPGGTKMDMASMLDEAIHYVKFLKTQVQSLERVSAVNGGGDSGARSCSAVGMGFPVPMSAGTYASSQSGPQFGDGFD